MTILPISLTFAASLALLNIWLSVRVGTLRISEKVLHGDGGVPTIQKRMRAHSNFTEYAPFVLILFVLVELAFGSPGWLWWIAVAYVVARLIHALGMDSDTGSKLRTGGIALNHVVILALAVAALIAAYRTAGADEVKSFDTQGVAAEIVPAG